MNNSEWLQKVFSVVGQYAPEILTKMQQSRWIVEAVSSGEDLVEFSRQWGRYHAMSVAHDLSTGALGLTAMGALNGRSWLNRPLIQEEAHKTGVSVDELGAAVLVHEFMHKLGHENEVIPYTAEAQFAMLMGNHAIANRALRTRRRITGR